jgi:nucleoside-diphosphate-sugar epimerase
MAERTMPRVLLTGATGYIVRQLLPAYGERYDLKLLDVREEDGSGNRIEGMGVVDLLGEDRIRLEHLFSDAGIVVHTGHRKPIGEDPSPNTMRERRNVDMMQRVYQLELECGVRRVVAASTNQAAYIIQGVARNGLRG